MFGMFLYEVEIRDRITLLSSVLNKYINSILMRETDCESYTVIVLHVDKKYLHDVIFYLKYESELLFNTLLDIWGVDYPSRENRFEINYMFVSVKFQLRLVIKVATNADEYLDSIVDLYNSAGWLEREVWDMYGVYFSNNPDLRRILTDYGFKGFPLRKDFPLSGYTEVRYDDGEKRVLSEPVELSQDYRYFNFSNPWSN